MTKRTIREISVAAAFAALLISTGPTTAAGFWECRSGVWVGVGGPAHAEPLRACGAKPGLPTTESACRAAGGRWGRAGLSRRPICTVPTRDAGRVCGDGQECEGACLLDTKGDRPGSTGSRASIPATGRCTRVRPVFGCMVEVTRGRVGGWICRD